MKKKKILVSGIKATGSLHFGNYFGAMKQNIDLSNSDEYESYIFIANYHALTILHSKEDAIKLKNYIYEAVASYIACGLNPKYIFRQLPVETELAVIFSNFVSMPYMMRAHAFKDHEAKNKEVNVGLFTYPILMAADILLYDADIVPVGNDQKQHIEYTREIARQFNYAYKKECFKLPKEFIFDMTGLIPGIDGRKMSKSYDNHIELFCDEEKLRKRVMSIVTDSLRPEDKKIAEKNNIFNIHKNFLNKEEQEILKSRFENSSPQKPYSYKEAKEELLETIIKWRKDKIQIYNELISNKHKIDEILMEGEMRAAEKANTKIKEIREIIGL